MDVLRIALATEPLAPRPISADVADRHGARTLELAGAAAEPVLAAAAPLVDDARALLAELAAIEIDFVARRLTLMRSFDRGVGRVLDGDAFAARLPLAAAVARALVTAARRAHATAAGRAFPSSSPATPSDPRFWGSVYDVGDDGWELARAAPPLARWFAQHPPAGKRALVTGCGRGHDARMLARLGAHVVAVDFAAQAIAEARRLAAAEGAAVEFLERDLFTLGDDPALRGSFDVILEHCCFCAIDPARRREYVDVAARLLRDHGELVGLFYTHGRPGGPPFSVADDELARLFDVHFELISSSVPPDSVAARHGDERLVHFRRR